MSFKKQKGFTLIELLVVVSIVSLLSSIILASLVSVRAKARDTRRISDFNAIKMALTLYYDKYGTVPDAPPGSTAGLEICDGINTQQAKYDEFMQSLINEGFLSAIPRNPGGNSFYCYYKYPSISPAGGLLVTMLEVAPNTTTGSFSSCRPFPATDNWCSSVLSSKYYCICNPY